MIIVLLLACVDPDANPCAEGLPALLGTISDETGNTNIGATLNWALDGGERVAGECDTILSDTNCVVWRAGTEPGEYIVTGTAAGYQDAEQAVTVELNDVDSAFISTGMFQLTLLAAGGGR